MGDSGCLQTLQTNCTPPSVEYSRVASEWCIRRLAEIGIELKEAHCFLNCTRGWSMHQSLANSRDLNQLLQSPSFQSRLRDSGSQRELWGSAVLSLEHLLRWDGGPDPLSLCVTHSPQDWILELWVVPSSWFGGWFRYEEKADRLPNQF